MDVPDYKTTVAFLAMLDVTPDGTPGQFDVMARELAGWWKAGGSCREFVEHHRRAESRSLPEPKPAQCITWREAFEQLQARYVP